MSDEGVAEIVLHGHRRAYRQAGDGPVVVLIHGIAGSLHQWDAVVPALAERFTVVVPELAGHGSSVDETPGDQSLGAHASAVRDLLAALGHTSATIVGHSLGGGIAMQFAYQFPAQCERLVLVASGGLGPDVSWLLRAAALPGSELVLPLIAHPRLTRLGRTIGRWGRMLGVQLDGDSAEALRSFSTLEDPQRRSAFLHTVRAVIDHRGQRVSATDRLYLSEQVPCLIVWGDADRIIPASHGHRATALIPGSRLEIFGGSGHFPHLTQPDRFVRSVISFVEETPPAHVDAETFRQALGGRTAPTVAAVTAVSP